MASAMKSVTPATAMQNSNRRTQPTRQTRTNPPRGSVASGRTYPGGRSMGAGSPLENGNLVARVDPGFFPATTHFTDAITALPKDIIRHFTLLKEVDAKLHGPEEAFGQLITGALHTPAPPRRVPYTSPYDAIVGNAVADSASASTNGIATVTGPSAARYAKNNSIVVHEPPPDEPLDADGEPDLARRTVFFNIRSHIADMLSSLDEKNHVISTANEALNKQINRIETVFPFVEGEISEEARYGGLNHWAYQDKSGAKGTSTVTDRPRREGAATNGYAAAINEGETIGSRSESRREAMLAKKQRNNQNQVDSDFEDGRGHAVAGSRQRDAASAQPATVAGTKRAHTSSKTKKTSETAANLGLGITNTTASPAINPPPAKRRKTEKAAAASGLTGGAAMEKTPSAIANSTNGKGNEGSPRQVTPVVDTSKKRSRGTAATGGQTRKRNNGSNSVAQSPSLVSSPIAGTFATSKDSHRSSPVPGAAQRPASSRARQNSTASLAQENALTNPRNRPSSSASNKPGQSNGVSANTPDVTSTPSATGRTTTETKSSAKESHNKRNLVIETDEHPRKESVSKGTPNTSVPKSARAAASEDRKKDDTPSNNVSTIREETITAPVMTTTRNAGRASKTATPTVGSFPHPATSAAETSHRSSRPSRGTAKDTDTPPTPSATATSHHGPVSVAATKSRSHKKGASALHQAQLALAAQAKNRLNSTHAEEEGSSMQEGDDEEDDGDEDEDSSEPRYCYCNQISYGEMVACDADNCPREWFHLDCVGLTKAPSKNSKWYCDECKENLKKGKVGGGR